MATKKKALRSSGQKVSKAGWDIFLSHSSQNDDLATRLEQTLQSTGINVWVDHSDLRRKGLLLSALQEALLKCVHLVLLWSEAAVQSRYVTAEWNFAWNRQIPIVPCRLDKTLLPLGLAGYLYCDFRTDFNTGYTQLNEALHATVRHRSLTKFRYVEAVITPAYQQVAGEISHGQEAILTAIGQGRLDIAGLLQAGLDPVVMAAVGTYPQDAYMLSAAGYQKKNAYLLKYWREIQARQSPPDLTLAESEKYFWEALQVQPDYPAALNGLGSVLWLQGDLEAAEFYVQRSLERPEAEGISYAQAEEDLKNIRREIRLRQERRT